MPLRVLTDLAPTLHLDRNKRTLPLNVYMGPPAMSSSNLARRWPKLGTSVYLITPIRIAVGTNRVTATQQSHRMIAAHKNRP